MAFPNLTQSFNRWLHFNLAAIIKNERNGWYIPGKISSAQANGIISPATKGKMMTARPFYCYRQRM